MNAQTLKVAAADREFLVNALGARYAYRLRTHAIKVWAAEYLGHKLTEDRINKALGRFYRNYGGKLSALTPHKAAMLEAARKIAPFPLNDQYLLNTIGQADTERGAMARITKMLERH